MIENNVEFEMANNMVKISKLIEEIDPDQLDPKAAELITRLMVFQRQCNDVAALPTTNITPETMALLAEQSFISQGFDEEVDSEQVEAAKKARKINDALKAAISSDLHKLLVDLDEANTDRAYIDARKAYKEGFRHAVEALKSNKLH